MNDDGTLLRIVTPPWIIPFTVAYYNACHKMRLTPDEQAMMVMARLSMRLAIYERGGRHD